MEDKLGIVRAILSDPHYWIPALLILLCLFWMGGRLIYVERHKMLVNPIRTEKYGFLPIEENKPVIKSEQENALPKIKVEKKKPSIIQNIESGGAGIQNNAPNYGNQSISVNPEPQLTHVLKKQIIELVGDLVKKHNTDTFGFELVNGSRGGKILSQIQDALKEAGYDLNSRFDFINVVYSESPKGIQIFYDTIPVKNIHIRVGLD